MPIPRLLALTTSQEEGGAEWFLRTTLGAAETRGYEVTVALPRYAKTAQLWEALTAAGWHVRALPIGRLTTSRAGAYLAILIDTLRVLRTIVRVRPDAIFLNLPTPEASPGAMLACALSRLPTTAMFLLVRADHQATPLRRRLYQLIARGSQRWVCNSSSNRAVLASSFGVDPGRIAVVRNGIDLRPVSADGRDRMRAELEIPPDATLVLTTARLSKQKDHRVIVEALPRLIAREAGLVFVWVGDGPLREDLTAAVAATGLQRHVRLLGRREDLPELLAAADLFLMPSRDEGGAPPFALAEAMSAGVPAVVSDAGALAETIEDRDNGLVFARGDADELLRAIDWALSHPKQLASIAARAREQALREFTVQRMLDDVMTHVGPHLSNGAGG
jgi:glycosyltransferase involved in cell wall biosynthesis